MTLISMPPDLALYDFRSTMVLQRAMSSTHSLHQFRKLKRTIRDLRKEKQVPPGKRFAELEDSVKNAILGAVLHRSPAIARYTEYWPVATYFDFDSKRHAARETRRAPKRPLNVTSSSADPNFMAIASKRARLSGLRHPSMAGPDKALSRPPRFFVGKPPPGVASQMVVHVDESRAFAMYVRARVGKPTNDAMPDKERSMALVKGGTALLAVSCTPPEEVNSSPPTKAPSIPGGRIDVKCPRCRYLPESSSPWLHNAVLRDVVNNPVHLRIFREMGLASDGHLHVLRGWSLKERSLLLDWVDPSLIKPWDKLLLLKRFQAAEKLLDLAYCAVEEAHRLPQGISQPGPEDEEQITDPGQPLSLLRKAMNIPEEHHFQQVINTMAAGIRDYLHSYFPSPDLLEATVKKVVASGSYFDRYENHWPIRFYIKRNVRRLRNKPLDHTGRVMLGGLNALDVPESSRHPGLPKSTPSTSCPRSVDFTQTHIPEIRCGCPIHRTMCTSMSPTIKQFLTFRGLPDLIPVFAQVGIMTNRSFLSFCSLEDDVKMRLFSDTRAVDISDFQSMVLRLELTPEKISPYAKFFCEME